MVDPIYIWKKLLMPDINWYILFITLKLFTSGYMIVKVNRYFPKESKNKNGFTRPYDFSKLPDGKYQFIIKGSHGIVVREIIHKYQHNDLNVSIVDAGKDHSYKLIVKGVSENPVYVDIYDNNTGLVLEDIIKVGRDFSRVYSFENIQGKYLNFIISQENNYISKIVK